jgi:Inner membrane component of T3SS, cytoplasmic domain
VRSYLLSTLRLQFGAQGLDAFKRQAPHHWLLWDPGRWQPPLRRTAPLPTVDGDSPAAREAGSEALAFELKPLTRPVVLGRAPECDLVITDGTLSARHLAFHQRGEGWAVEDLLSMNGSRVNRTRLTAGQLLPLVDGAQLEMGQVLLQYWSSEGLWPKLKAP